MASKTYKVAGGGTATVTTNSDGSRSISFSNNVGGGYGGSTITGTAGGTSVTRTNSNGTTQTGTISGSGKGTSISWNDTPSSNGGGGSDNNSNNNNPGFEPVNNVDFGSLQFGQGTSDSTQGSRNDMLGRFYAGKDNVTADSIRNDLMGNAGFANASAADQQNTINRIMNLQNQYRNSGGGGAGNELNELGDKIQNPYPQKQDYPDYSGQFEGIKNYINNLSGDLSGMRDLMEKNNTMFLSKLDAQMTQQKAMEEKFNAEWSKIEGQMDENTKAQKTRLDQMEQKYNENLQKMQDMLTDYYTGTMDALEAKAAGESAAAASDLSAKGLNSAVVANTTAGLDKNYREQFNTLMKNNIELGQQLNNDYADFMQQIFNNHDTLDQNQIKTLQYGLEQKQKYWQQENDIINGYIDNVYKPMEDYLGAKSEAYKENAKTTTNKEIKLQEYKQGDKSMRQKILYDNLVSLFGDQITTVSDTDLQRVMEAADKYDDLSEALIYILQGSRGDSNSAIGDALSNINSNGGYVSPSPTKTPSHTKTPGGTETETEGETTTEEGTEGEEGTTENSLGEGLLTKGLSTSLGAIKRNGDTLNGKRKATEAYMDEIKKKIKELNSEMFNYDRGSKLYDTCASAKAKLEKEYTAAKEYRNSLSTNINQLSYEDPTNRKGEAALQPTKLFAQAKTDFDGYNSLVNDIVEKGTWSADKKYKKLLEVQKQMKQSLEGFVNSSKMIGIDINSNIDFVNRIKNYQSLNDKLNKYLAMYK